MRIAVVNNFFPPRVGGSSHLSDSLARGYASAGHDVLVVTAAYADAPGREVRDGVQVVRLPAVTLPQTPLSVSFDISFATRPMLARSLARILDGFRPDVFHLHGQFFDLTWAAGTYARKRGLPVLLTVHTRLENPNPTMGAAFRALDATLVAPRLRRYLPRIVVTDSLMLDYIQARYRGGFSGLVDIPVGVDPVFASQGVAIRGREWMGVGESPVILSVGHVIPVRDRVGIVEALPAVLREHPDVRLVVVGRVYFDAFLKRANALGVRDAIHLTGSVPQHAIPDMLAACDVEAHEQGIGIGTATLEAMAAGVPVVGWGRLDNYPGISLRDGQDIHMVPPGDVAGLAQRLILVLRDPQAARVTFRRAAATIRESFTLDLVLEAHLRELVDLTR